MSWAGEYIHPRSRIVDISSGCIPNMSAITREQGSVPRSGTTGATGAVMPVEVEVVEVSSKWTASIRTFP